MSDEKQLANSNQQSAAPRCPRCFSPAPHLHPAVQFEGEAQVCTDDFHLTLTPQNTPAKIRTVIHERYCQGADLLSRSLKRLRAAFHYQLPRDEAQANLDARAIILRTMDAVLTEGELNATMPKAVQ